MFKYLIACFAVALSASAGPALRSGATLEVRLITPLNSRASHPGDKVEAVVIAPAVTDRALIPLEGATLTGAVETAKPIGLGIHRAAAEINVLFNRLRLPDGSDYRIEARIQQIETARERVDPSGRIVGIHPAMCVSSGFSFFMTTFLVHSELEAPAAVIKFLAARSPDSEIRLPAGSEMFVRLERDLGLDDVPTESPASLPFSDAMVVRSALQRLPIQQAEETPHHSSDLVNVVLLGSPQAVDSAFRAAGWRGETNHSALALYRMFHSLVQRMGYGTAPMARLRLNGALPTSTYQKSLDTLAKRHHVRLWQQEGNIWMGAATEDIGFAVKRMRLTHAIDSDIDNERAKIVNDLWLTGCVQSASLLRRPDLRTMPREDFAMKTDGDLAVLRLGACHPDIPPALGGRLGFKQAFQAVGTDMARANPATVGMTLFRMIAAKTRTAPAALVQEPVERSSIIDTRVGELGKRN